MEKYTVPTIPFIVFMVIAAVGIFSAIFFFASVPYTSPTAPSRGFYTLAACYDTDGGNNIFVYGNCTDSNGTTYVDNCLGGAIREYHCVGGACILNQTSCPSGYSCDQGACVLVPATNATVILNSPANNSQALVPGNITFNWTPSNFSAASVSCDIYVDGGLSYVKSCTVNQSCVYSDAGATLTPGSHSWSVTCDTDSSETWNFNITGYACGTGEYSSGRCLASCPQYWSGMIGVTCQPGTGGCCMPPNCSDSDNGNNISVQGTCLDKTGAYDDTCKIETECTMSIGFNDCLMSEDVSYLYEYYCGSGLCRLNKVKCNCQNGTCVSLDTCAPAGGACSFLCFSNKKDSSKNCPDIDMGMGGKQAQQCCMPPIIVSPSPADNSTITQASSITLSWLPTRFSLNPNCSVTMNYPSAGPAIVKTPFQCTNGQQCNWTIASSEANLSVWPGGAYNWSVRCDATWITHENASSAWQFNVSVCGNGIVEGTETCDGTNLNGKTCASLGYTGGSLSCASSCTFDTSACTSGGDHGGTTCHENWTTIQSWSPAVCPASGIQTQVIRDKNDCGRKPSDGCVTWYSSNSTCVQKRNCTYVCPENWQCSGYGACMPEGKKYQTCNDLGNCGTNYTKPALEQNCIYVPPVKTCAEQGGKICASDENCSTSIVPASDTDSCCAGTCIIPFKGTAKQLTTWIAIGLAVIIIALVIFLVLKRPRGMKMPAVETGEKVGVPSELANYVLEARKQKISDKEIRSKLGEYGWQKDLIDLAMKK